MKATYLRFGRGESLNSIAAKGDGKWPKSHAARVLGVSQKAFMAGIVASGISSCEWHHTGKYATVTEFWDTEEIASDQEFWRGAAAAYKGRRREELLKIADEVQAENERISREFKREMFKNQLIRQRDCSVRTPRHSTFENAVRYVARAFGLDGYEYYYLPERAKRLVNFRGMCLGKDKTILLREARRHFNDSKNTQLRLERQQKRIALFESIADSKGTTKRGNIYFIVDGVRFLKGGQKMKIVAEHLTPERAAEWGIVLEKGNKVSAKSVMRALRKMPVIA